ncbi:metallophosphoesterase [Quadrisphaera sp. INWT6]|uniref:metallophosphoesterase family protein n=1 Tax=Quadrisphaera sp. INWT6 TaxID=2596917 RepID=UPI00189244E4|nr:YfcE family phosphodiesterase [Quadrisphaera sp. INWT6]MBF5082819.1 YfcE family phosphodiesterase [Quadrisphaera sp. INWT6]
MATRLLLLADTHVPVRARALPAQVLDAVAALGPGDLLVHAGDWVHEDLLDDLLARCATTGARLLGVAGNNDGPELHSRLPEVARADVGGLRLAVVHETGAAAGRERRCAERFGSGDQPADVLVFGHSHIPWDTTAVRPGGGALRLLNPGSPTDRRRQPACTLMTAVVDGGALHDVVLREVVREVVGRG